MKKRNKDKVVVERSAYIEFMGTKTLKITTPFRQKAFNLDNLDKQVIDLISLKVVGEWSSATESKHPLYAHILKNSDDEPFPKDYRPSDLEKSDFLIYVYGKAGFDKHRNLGLLYSPSATKRHFKIKIVK